MMSRTAGFHDDQADLAIQEPAFELRAREALRLDKAPMLIGNGNLENTLGQIHGHGRSMHVGLIVFVKLIPTPMETSTVILRGKQTGESIPSLVPTRVGKPPLSAQLSRWDLC
ncbi:hypothetical protein LZ017_03995 [Pelomonas sp. CA6]|uniref:hypothetical protein n=1 Tax=Pelomonas sp. CA6 TaxID=2907999 RepID=UPI001F4A40DF|nr:hypothetical protein [Pelomonas sp. CA6]MCH7342540.1 hypothetical protein [Pelomonas sp. CA6]